MVSTIYASRCTNELFKDNLVEKNWTQSCRVTLTTMETISVSYWILLLITSLSRKEVLSHEEAAIKEDKLASLRLLGRMHQLL